MNIQQRHRVSKKPGHHTDVPTQVEGVNNVRIQRWRTLQQGRGKELRLCASTRTDLGEVTLSVKANRERLRAIGERPRNCPNIRNSAIWLRIYCKPVLKSKGLINVRRVRAAGRL